MKRKGLIAAAVGVAVALAYPATAWVLGGQVATALDDSYKLLAEYPYAKIVKRDYQRGVFSSTEVVTIEFFGDIAKSLAKAQAAAVAENPQLEAGPAEVIKPVQIAVRSEIKHGPLPGAAGFAAAVVDSELVLEGDVQAGLAELIGNKKPLQAHTVYGFSGSGVSTVTSPAFSGTFAGKEEGVTHDLAWDGVTMTIDFERNLNSYTLRAEAPKLEIKNSQGGQVVMTGLQVQGKQKRLFDDEPMLYAGAMKLAVASVSIASGKPESAPLQVTQIAYDVEVPVDGEFIDIAAKVGAEVVQVGQQSYGPAHYDISVNHLHARTMAKLYRAWLKLYSDPALFSGAAPAGGPGKLFEPLREPAFELLKHNPEVRVDRISFNSPHGETRLAARARLKDATPADFASPLSLLGRLDAGAEISLPEGLIGEFAAAREKTPEDAAARGALLQQQLAGFAEQGYIHREGGAIKSKIAFANGRVAVNGKPFPPMPTGGPQ